MAEFRMPSLGADMEAGTIVEWRVQPGDEVQRGQIVALVETEKADIEVEVFTSGIVEDILVPVGERVPVGAVLATIGSGAAVTSAAPLPAPEPARDEPAAAEPEHDHAAVTSPLVRHLADELHVDLDHVEGTGRGGRVTRADVERAAAGSSVPAPPPAPPPAEPAGARSRERPPRRPKLSPRARRLAAQQDIEPELTPPAAVAASAPAVELPEATARPQKGGARSSLRQAVGRAMARSKREIPHYYLSTPVDMGPALAWLDEHNEEGTVADRVLPAAVLLAAVARAARAHPEMNGTYDPKAEQHVPHDGVDLAVAVALREGGLVAPVIEGADRMDLGELMAALKGLVARARRNSLRGSDLVPGTITVTSLGDATPGGAGVAQLLPVITPPQVAAVGIGAIRDQPWAHDGLLGVRPVVWISVAADHRVSDGRDGARFLATIDDLLAHPDTLGAHP